MHEKIACLGRQASPIYNGFAKTNYVLGFLNSLYDLVNPNDYRDFAYLGGKNKSNFNHKGALSTHEVSQS